MTNVKHTPGAWYAETSIPTDNATVWARVDDDQEWPAPIAHCGDYEERRPVAEAQANARLIAAAPALLAALHWAVGMAEEAILVREGGDDPEDTAEVIAMHREALAKARAAIAAAEGCL